MRDPSGEFPIQSRCSFQLILASLLALALAGGWYIVVVMRMHYEEEIGDIASVSALAPTCGW